MFKSITKLLISFAFIMGGRFSKETLAMHQLLLEALEALTMLNQEIIQGSKSVFEQAISEYKEKAMQIYHKDPSDINLKYLEHTNHLDLSFIPCPELVKQFWQECSEVKFFVDYFRIMGGFSRIYYITHAIGLVSIFIMIGKIPAFNRDFAEDTINKLSAMAIVSNDPDLRDEIILFQNKLQKILKSTNIQERNTKIEEMRTMIESMIASLE